MGTSKKLDMEEMNAKEIKQKRKHVILNHAPFIASGQSGLNGIPVPKVVDQEYLQGIGLLKKKLDMGEMNVMERKLRRKHVILNHALFIASGQTGLDGVTAPKIVDQEYLQGTGPQVCIY